MTASTQCEICGSEDAKPRYPGPDPIPKPGCAIWHCALCRQLPPEPDLTTDLLDQMEAQVRGVWNPGDPWPPRPRRTS
ncbi:hypothetical protein ACGFOU_14580 [Streptomyces sp. NPDC048595]|uniref:hypothetical protein n=1 Tax=Streptomyces sp. NPDC048595 TaxID=3365576 RepID=UPI0037189797